MSARHSAELRPDASRVGLAAVNGPRFVLDTPKATAVIREVGDSNTVLRFYGWVDQTRTDFPKARSLAIKAAKAAPDIHVAALVGEEKHRGTLVGVGGLPVDRLIDGPVHPVVAPIGRARSKGLVRGVEAVEMVEVADLGDTGQAARIGALVVAVLGLADDEGRVAGAEGEAGGCREPWQQGVEDAGPVGSVGVAVEAGDQERQVVGDRGLEAEASGTERVDGAAARQVVAETRRPAVAGPDEDRGRLAVMTDSVSAASCPPRNVTLPPSSDCSRQAS